MSSIPNDLVTWAAKARKSGKPTICISVDYADRIAVSDGWYNDCQVEFGNQWVPARPQGWWSLSSRFKLAWAVFTGRYDALRWPGQEF